MVDWDDIIDREGPAVWRTVCRLLTHRADAEECFQETFVAALELWRRQPVRSARAVLQRLATARAVDRLRQRYRAGARRDEGDDAAGRAVDRSPSPPDHAAAAELAESLRTALADLPPKQADVFCLHCLDGFSYREVAEALGMSVDDVGVTLHRARARLREALGGQHRPENDPAPSAAPQVIR
jgi:RNA polymerase sigma-70 factor (ECF subfamily)